METKVCSKCGRELPTTEFSRKSASKDGLQGYCKHCSSKSAAESVRKKRAIAKTQKIANERIEFEKKYKIYTCKELATFSPRDLMLELKARGYEGELVYIERIVKEHRIKLSTLN